MLVKDLSTGQVMKTYYYFGNKEIIFDEKHIADISPEDYEKLKKGYGHFEAIEKFIENLGDTKLNYKPKVDIIILSFNSCFVTQNLIESIKEKTNLENVTVHVFDNNSTEKNVAMLSKFDWIKLYVSNENLGFAKAVNIVMRQTKDDYVLLLNNDMLVTDNWLDKLLSIGEEHEDWGIIGCKLLYHDYTIQHAGGFMARPDMGDHYGRGKDYRTHNEFRECEYVTGACMFIKRAVIDKIGYLDEKYFFYMEDVDYCRRANKAGFKVMYSPQPILFHYEKLGYKTLINKYANNR